MEIIIGKLAGFCPGVENTIKAIGELARVGMCETDKEIIYIMTH